MKITKTLQMSTIKTLHCVKKKTCDYIFDDKLNKNCPFTTIFSTLITTDRYFYFPTLPRAPTLPSLGNCQPNLNVSKN